jgi:HEAT repeat protein
VTLTVVAIIGIAQLIFAALLAVYLFVHRREAERRERDQRDGAASTAAAVREWLIGSGTVGDLVHVLDELPGPAARVTAQGIARRELPREAREALAGALNERHWVRGGASAASPLWWKRLDAARLLADLGTAADDDTVRRLLADEHPAVRVAATSCLRRIASPGIVELVLDQLPKQPAVVRGYQLAVLREQWRLASEALVPRLNSDAPAAALAQWVTVAEALEAPDALARAVPFHSHPDVHVRISVARAMKKFFHPSVAPALAQLLEDGDWRVRAQAARSAGVLRESSAIPALTRCLSDSSWWVRFRSALALSQLGEAGRRALRDARASNDRFTAQMATMVSGLSPGSVVELVEG